MGLCASKELLPPAAVAISRPMPSDVSVSVTTSVCAAAATLPSTIEPPVAEHDATSASRARDGPAAAYLVSVVVSGLRCGDGADSAGGGELWVTVSVGGASETARLPTGGTPRLDLPLLALPQAVRVEVQRRDGEKPGLVGFAEVSLADGGDVVAARQATPSRAAPTGWVSLSGGEAAAVNAALALQVTCAALSSTGAGDRAKLAYASSVGLTTLRLEALEPSPPLLKSIAAIVGGRAAREGAYTLRISLTHGLRAFTSHGFAPDPPDVDAADSRRTGAAATMTSIPVGQQDCRVWVRAQETRYVCPVTLYVEGPRPVRHLPHLPHLPHMLQRGAAASPPAPPPPPPPRLVTLARGYLDTASLQDGAVHAFRISLIATGRSRGGAAVRSDLTDAGEVLLLRSIHRAEEEEDERQGGAAGAASASASSPGHPPSPSPSPPHVARIEIPADEDDAVGDGAAADTPLAAGDVDGGALAAGPGSPVPAAEAATAGAAVDDEGFGFNSPGVHGHRGGGGVAFLDDSTDMSPMTRRGPGDGDATPTLGVPSAATRRSASPWRADVLDGADEGAAADALAAAPAVVAPPGARHLLGVLRVRAIFQPKADVESWFYSRLLETFDADGDGALEVSEATALLETLGADMNAEDVAALVARIDGDGDGVLRADELLAWMRSADFQSLPIGYSLLSVLARGEHGLDSVVNDVCDIAHPAEKASRAGAGVAVLSDPSGRAVRDELGLYCVDRETGLVVQEFIPKYVRLALRLMYSSQVGRSAVSFSSIKAVLRRLSAREGALMNSPRSAHRISAFVRAFNIDLSEVAQPPGGVWTTFNQFFSRELLPAARPIASPDDASVLVSPADCRIAVFPTCGDATRVWIKGDEFSVERLLGPAGAHLVPRFQNGAIVVARLAPQDYHRWHVPLSCTQVSSWQVEGALYTVNPMAIRQRHPSVYTDNQRVCVLLRSDVVGEFVCIAVGATVVGSINLLTSDGAALRKGEQHGYFAFGGSTVLFLFQPRTIAFDADIAANSTQPLETIVKVGARIGGCRVQS